jgi:hypothetical protein
MFSFVFLQHSVAEGGGRFRLDLGAEAVKKQEHDENGVSAALFAILAIHEPSMALIGLII